jgi:hypothetical protein
MKTFLIVALAASSVGLAGCTTGEKIASGAGIGAAIGASTTHSLGGALVGAAIGGVATAIVVKDLHNGWCTYRAPSGRLYNARCRY